MSGPRTIESMIAEKSPVQCSRLLYIPRLPPVLRAVYNFRKTGKTSAVGDKAKIQRLFPLTCGQEAVRLELNAGGPVSMGHKMKIGVVLSGGPAPGGHNVIAGLLDFLRTRNVNSELIGFLDGPSGIIDGKYLQLDYKTVAPFRNMGGFHIIGSGRTKIESEKQFAASKATCEKLDLDGLVVVGGDDSNTNAAVLAEFFLKEQAKTKVIGVPKTIDGDLRNEFVETSFGFDTATKLYSEMIANLSADAVSARKMYHFVRLMGRSASHITLECALQTHPNIVLIGEEVEHNQSTIMNIVTEICDVICKRAERKMNYGTVLLPEGLVDFMPDISKLIRELNDVLSSGCSADDVTQRLTPESAELFNSLPEFIGHQLLLDRDPHGNVQVSKIESERLLVHYIGEELKSRKKAGTYVGTFNPACHFLGYEGRCGLPSNFDANYCYTLGYTAGALLEGGFTGMMATASNLLAPVDDWVIGGMPLTHMMNIEYRSGHDKPVIRKALVDVNDKPFKVLSSMREDWKYADCYRDPGSIQYFGPMADAVNFTLQLTQSQELHLPRA